MTLKTVLNLRDISLKMYLLRELQDPGVKAIVSETNQGNIEEMLNSVFERASRNWERKHFRDLGLSDFPEWSENVTPPHSI